VTESQSVRYFCNVTVLNVVLVVVCNGCKLIESICVIHTSNKDANARGLLEADVSSVCTEWLRSTI